MFRKNERLCCTIEFHEKEKSQSKKSHITKKKKKKKVSLIKISFFRESKKVA